MPRLLILKNGDVLPEFDGLYDQDDIEAFVSDYLEEDGRTVKIPQNSLIIFAEMDYAVYDSADFQDMVVLINFRNP